MITKKFDTQVFNHIVTRLDPVLNENLRKQINNVLYSELYRKIEGPLEDVLRYQSNEPFTRQLQKDLTKYKEAKK